MWKQAAITGTVVDEAGEPVVGVHIRAFRRRSIAGRFEISGASLAETDDRGAYRLSGLWPGEYLVMAGARQIAVPPAWAQRATASIRQPPGSPGTASAIEVGGSVYTIGRGNAVPPAPRSGRLVIYPLIFHPAAVTPGTATPVSLASGEERTGIDILLQPTPTARVSGKVTWQGQAAAGEALRLLPGGRGEWLGGIGAGYGHRAGWRIHLPSGAVRPCTGFATTRASRACLVRSRWRTPDGRRYL